MTKEDTNIFFHKTSLNKHDRQNLIQQKSFVLWFTGLSASGKSTIANEVEGILFRNKLLTYLLDGDNIRSGLNKDLGFNPKDRKESVRRVSHLANLYVDAGVICLVSLISPFREDREYARSLFEPNEFIEIYIKCPLNICENRDPKGLYHKARNGFIQNFTGIDSPYEEPVNPEIIVDSDRYTSEEATSIIIDYLQKKRIIE